jgi:hypothetical protein
MVRKCGRMYNSRWFHEHSAVGTHPPSAMVEKDSKRKPGPLLIIHGGAGILDKSK